MTGPATHASHGSSRAVAGVNLRPAHTEPLKLSDQLERWLTGDGEKTLAGPRHQKLIAGLMKWIRRLERISRPRLSFVWRCYR